MTDALLAGLLAGYAIAVPVGAIGVLLLTVTARTNLRVGAAAALGVASADGLYATAAVLGGAAAARLIAPVSGPLRAVAAVVLLAVAARTAWTAVRHYRDPLAVPARRGLDTPARAYTGLLGLTLLNPATVVYFAALVLARRSEDPDPAAQVIFVVAAFAASASWQLLLAGGGRVVGRVLGGPRGRAGTALVSAAAIAVLAVVTLAFSR